jgi:molybdopterin converting factor small subunit
MGMEKFYSKVRKQLGLEKEELKQELKEEVTEELREELGEEISYIEAQLKEYEQLVAEVNHLLATMRKDRIKKRSEGEKIKMEDMDDDIQPLKSKLRELEKSMQERLEEGTAYS